MAWVSTQNSSEYLKSLKHPVEWWTETGIILEESLRQRAGYITQMGGRKRKESNWISNPAFAYSTEGPMAQDWLRLYNNSMGVMQVR